MEVTEHYGNFHPDWTKEEVVALLKLIKNEINSNQDKSIQMFYAKIYGKLLGERFDAQWVSDESP
jgi:hypothetical protein